MFAEGILLPDFLSTITVTSDETEEALKDATSQIVDAVHSVLERTPPELAADIADRRNSSYRRRKSFIRT